MTPKKKPSHSGINRTAKDILKLKIKNAIEDFNNQMKSKSKQQTQPQQKCHIIQDSYVDVSDSGGSKLGMTASSNKYNTIKQ